MHADSRLIMAARGLRAVSYGLLSVILGVGLSNAGFSPAAVGSIITVSLVGDFCGTYVIGVLADSWGRRRTLKLLAILMAATGVVFGLTNNLSVLLVAAFFGTLGTTASETAPFLPIEQASLAEISPPETRTELFVTYNIVAWIGGGIGALLAGIPDLLARIGLASSAAGVRLMFGVYALLAILVVGLVSRLSEAVEVGRKTAPRPDEPRWRLVPPLGGSRRTILVISGLFSIDALAGGLVVQSLIALYLHLRFGQSLGTLAVLFFAAYLLSALSFLGAARIARRFGLLNTMVFTHLPSNILLIMIPFMPNFAMAAAIVLIRQLLSQMDIPTRQAYTMAMVAPAERTAAAAVTSLARSAGSAATPVLSGLMLQGSLLTLGIPFLAAGGIKIGYDLALWRIFRRVRVDQG